MGEAGILGEDDRVELIRGDIVQMTPIGTRHAACVNRLTAVFSRLIAGRAVLQVQNPVTLDNLSEPQPDISLARPRSDFYETAHPGPQDVLLIVEVADTSIDYDRKVKAALYAENAVPELWIVDLTRRQVDTWRSPGPAGYRETGHLGPGESLFPLSFPDLMIPVNDIMGS